MSHPRNARPKGRRVRTSVSTRTRRQIIVAVSAADAALLDQIYAADGISPGDLVRWLIRRHGPERLRAVATPPTHDLSDLELRALGEVPAEATAHH